MYIQFLPSFVSFWVQENLFVSFIFFDKGLKLFRVYLCVQHGEELAISALQVLQCGNLLITGNRKHVYALRWMCMWLFQPRNSSYLEVIYLKHTHTNYSHSIIWVIFLWYCHQLTLSDGNFSYSWIHIYVCNILYTQMFKQGYDDALTNLTVSLCW